MNRRTFIKSVAVGSVAGTCLPIGFMNRIDSYNINLKLLVQVADKPNLNGRVYSKELLQREADRWKIVYVEENRALISRNPGMINLKDVVGLVNFIGMEDDKLVIEAEMLNVQGADEIWKLLTEGKASVRMSGIGTLTKQDNGTYKVENDWELVSLFITENPA